MSKQDNAIYEIHRLDALAAKDQWMNTIHPLVKLMITVIYIVVVVSFSQYDIIGLLPMAVYPVAGFLLAELSFRESIQRLRFVLPLVCVIGVFNPFFDRVPVDLGFITINAGVISMLTLMMKGVFTVLASYLLIATTSIEKICYALNLLHLPSELITLVLLIYRYIMVLIEEVNRLTQAYMLRAPGQTGIHIKAWGSLAGQLLLRSINRANAVYESMELRGYRSSFRYMRRQATAKLSDYVYLIVWMAIFALFRAVPVVVIIGNMF